MPSKPHQELYRRYRPKSFDGMIGNGPAVAVLRDMASRKAFPHCLLFTGPSGCGKTTLARIAARKLKVKDYDLKEVNCATVDQPLNFIREIQSTMSLSAMGGGNKMWILDEVQSLSRAKFAQQGLLKVLEDPPNHAYFALCTTDPNKLLKTILTRCYEVKVKSLTPKEMHELVSYVAESENIKVSDEVIEKIAEASEGSPRKALVILEQISTFEDEEEQIAAVMATGSEVDNVIKIAQELVFGRKNWKKVSVLLKDLTDTDPENARRAIMGYATAILLSDNVRGHKGAYLTLNAFRDPLYDSGRSGLVLACFEAVHGS